jgi:hypothetical protein
MSFAEKNKRWLLPVIGVGVAGVIWMNLSDRPAPPAGAPASAPLAAPRETDTDPAPVRAVRPLGVAPAEPDPELKALEAPPAAVYDPAPLILAGRKALTPDQRGPARPPRLHSGQWAALCPLPGVQPGSPAAQVKPQALPPLDFIFASGSGREAWMGGVGYRPGAVVRDGYVLSRITRTGVVLSGPSGPVAIPLKASAAPPETQKGSSAQP